MDTNTDVIKLDKKQVYHLKKYEQMVKQRFDLINKMMESNNNIDEFIGRCLLEAHCKDSLKHNGKWPTWKWINNIFRNYIGTYID